MAPLILSLYPKWRWVVSFTSLDRNKTLIYQLTKLSTFPEEKPLC